MCDIFTIKAQQKLSLLEVIDLAKTKSPRSLLASNIKKNRFWQYKTYLSNYNPQLVLTGTLPNLNRSIQPIVLPDGTQAFVNRSFINNDLQLGITQNVAATGGTFSVSTALSRIDILGTNNQTTSYLSTPIFLSVNQPLFQFNNLLWEKRIQPLIFQESEKKYKEDLEEVAVNSTEFFFNLLNSQIIYQMAARNKANNDTIYKIAKGRYEMGKIAENELLQLELSAMNSAQQMSQANLDLQTNTLALRNFLGGSNVSSDINLEIPNNIPEFEIDENIAIAQAKQNRQAFLAFKRRVLEAERDVAQARRNQQGVNIGITGSLGFTQSASNLADSYQNPRDQQLLSVNLRVPILDWGRQKARVQTALANEEVIKATISQEELNFEQEILVKTRLFKILRDRLKIGLKSDEIAQKRYDITQARYLIGKISITDLTIALNEKDQAKRAYIDALRVFWRGYYELRLLTLYDFESNQPIKN
ncbi:MAG: TolC family protein [Bacteroidetes bacterium]|nr:MAG: TolC family protein [Bacteroidota bacterium]TAG88704.1 MAG: TolC family protein [Bacteroidota bacterium]